MSEVYISAVNTDDAVQGLCDWSEKYRADKGHAPLAYVHS